MKLNEIFQASREPFHIGDGKELGSGVSSYVKTDLDDPHMVNKQQYNRYSAHKDGFNFFAGVVTKNQLWDNIHFPRIYAINNTNKDTPLGRWKMEKLFDLSTLSEDELESIIDRMFDEESAHKLKKDRRIFDQRLAYAIDDYVKGYKDYTVVDEEFKKALSILGKMVKKNSRLNVEIHIDNVMVRRTPTGPQLVITDPFGVHKY